ncbi:MAG: hypothetical protein BWK80_51575 [Desulfobacteraceae bacterium IS3]|nr:MAG: hypothetical protein BWK80_51575 [Desulfobacteraceae bacterium IS3]
MPTLHSCFYAGDHGEPPHIHVEHDDIVTNLIESDRKFSQTGFSGIRDNMLLTEAEPHSEC